MEIKDLLEIYTLTAQNIDSLWEFFVTVHMALFAAFFYLHKVEKYQLSIFFVSYVAFTLINIRAKINEYKAYNSIIEDMKDMCVNNTTHVCGFFNDYSPNDRINITVLVHSAAFLAVLFLSYKAWDSIKSRNC